jgi:hypothetical protein
MLLKKDGMGFSFQHFTIKIITAARFSGCPKSKKDVA